MMAKVQTQADWIAWADPKRKLAEAPRDCQLLGLSHEVWSFVAANGLDQILGKALEELSEAFGPALEVEFDVSVDPSDGRAVLSVSILVDDLKKSRQAMARFCFNWWYDQIASYGPFLGFRTVEKIVH